MKAREIITELEKNPDYEVMISVALLGGEIKGIEVNKESEIIILHDDL